MRRSAYCKIILVSVKILFQLNYFIVFLFYSSISLIIRDDRLSLWIYILNIFLAQRYGNTRLFSLKQQSSAMASLPLTTIHLDILIVAVKINWYLDKGMKIIMLPNRVQARIVFCSESSTFVLGPKPMPPDNTSSAGSLYEYELCKTKQKLHYQKKTKLHKQIRKRGREDWLQIGMLQDKRLLNSRESSAKMH